MFGVGLGELVIIAIVALIVLGPEKLPDLAKQVGKGLRELRRASNDLQGSLHEAMYADEIKDLREKYRPPTVAPALGTQARDQLSPEAIAKAIESAAVGNADKPADPAAPPAAAPVAGATAPSSAPVLAAPSTSQPATTVGATLAHDESAAPEPQVTVISPPRGQPS